ncbi:restriction endonuclease subunit S [uncultured Granulicatella sp.]|uniref:restriction endonuclease subunit S n=1 Tax=uncultured Granulicatella sp. TaxID=316089 RepID=UPI002804620F|nr:restriction endonuclease subunit S [uncultured Granulicatella sp.]
MGEGQKNVPKLRFKGYEDAWEQRKLGSEFKKVNERNDGTFGKGHWISVAKMYFQDPEKVQSNNIDTRTYVMRLGDIAFEGHPNNEFQFGRFVANDIGDGVVSELFPVYRHNNQYYNNYWKYAIQQERIMAPIFAKSITSSGNSSNKLDPKHFLRQKIRIATLEEQKNIGDFLAEIDNLITLHQRKYDALKLMKKTLLSRMFPKNGEDVPEIRFKGFTDAWEQRKLGEEVQIVMGQSPKGENYTDNPEDYILVQGNADMKEGKVFPRVWTTQVTKKAYKGDIILSVRAPVGDIGKTDYDVVIGRGVAAVKGNEFFYQLLGKLKQDGYWTKSSTGSTFDSINSNEIKDAKVTIPDANEQLFIGNYFKEMDNLITLHQRKLDELKNMKKTLLQQMFV